jgi:hypothetical protein
MQAREVSRSGHKREGVRVVEVDFVRTAVVATQQQYGPLLSLSTLLGIESRNSPLSITNSSPSSNPSHASTTTAVVLVSPSLGISTSAHTYIQQQQWWWWEGRRRRL